MLGARSGPWVYFFRADFGLIGVFIPTTLLLHLHLHLYLSRTPWNFLGKLTISAVIFETSQYFRVLRTPNSKHV